MFTDFKGTEIQLLETVTLSRFLDCSSHFYNTTSFFRTSPIPDLNLNQTSTFYCSLKFFSTKNSSYSTIQVRLYKYKYYYNNILAIYIFFLYRLNQR